MTKLVNYLRFLLYALLLAAVIWIALKAMRAIRLARELSETGATLQQEALTLQETENLTASMEVVREDLAEARILVTELQKTIWPFGEFLKVLAWVPVYGDDLAAVPYTLETMDSLLSSTSHVDTVFGPLVESFDAEQVSGQDGLVAFLEAIEAGDESLAEARHDLDSARRARAHIRNVQDLSPRLQSAIVGADRLIDVLDQAFIGIESLPPLLGADEPHHILILLQNADEIRPTGGFITSSAYVVVERGQIVEMTVLNSNSLEIDRFEELAYPPPPTPMYEYMNLPLWAFRDANWSPDFPTSAVIAADFYTMGREVPVDTIVAINQYTIRDFLTVAGEVTLEDGTIIHPDNVIGLFQDLWIEYSSEGGREARKDFIPELGPQLLERIMDINDPQEAIDYWRVAKRAGQHRQLLVYSTNLPIEIAVEQLGWEGAISTRSGDYLYVVDSNVGYNKTDLNVQRTMVYHVNLTNLGAPSSVLEIEYIHQGRGQRGGRGVCAPPTPELLSSYIESADDCYADFLRVYLPEDTEMLQSPWFEVPETYRWVSDPTAGRIKPLFYSERGREVYGGLSVEYALSTRPYTRTIWRETK
jgi:hypothetical protein